MPDVTADTKTRYSIYVPKPLARLNMGEWQKRETASPKFGYNGVSLQSDASLFVDVSKSTVMQSRGSFVGQAADWLQLSKGAMTLATSDTAMVAADGLSLMVAGAGQSPTYVLDHGDSLDPYPYNNLSLHYRIEEIQNGLFEFFRGRRDKDDPSRKKKFDAVTKTVWSGHLFWKDEAAFNSDVPGFIGTRKGAKEWDVVTDKEVHASLRGGFERVVEHSWQKLFSKPDGADWTFDAPNKVANPDYKPGVDHPRSSHKLKKKAPYDIFDGIGDLRQDPDLRYAHEEITTNKGAKTTELLRYGFSSYFSRFDPYLLLDPEAYQYDRRLSSRERLIGRVFARLNNCVVKMKRVVDVLYRLASIASNIALVKELQNAAGLVDAANGEVKAVRGQIAVGKTNVDGSQGSLDSQFKDEWASGAKKHLPAAERIPHLGPQPTKAQAQIRSGAPYTDDKKTKWGFYGGSRQLQTGDVLHVKVKDGNGKVTEFDTPALRFGKDPIPATAASLQSGKASSSLKFPPNAAISVKFDDEAALSIPLGAVGVGRPRAPSLPMSVPSFGLAGKTLTLSLDGGAPTAIPMPTTNDANDVKSAMIAALPTLDVSFDGSTWIVRSTNCGPGASIEVVAGKPSTDAAPLLGLQPGKYSGTSAAELVAYVQRQIGSRAASLPDGGLRLTSNTTGAKSSVALDETPAGGGVLDGLGFASKNAKGRPAGIIAPGGAADLTADQLVALFSQTAPSGAVNFSAVDGQIIMQAGGDGGDGSTIEVSGDMATSLDFIGDTRGDKSRDEIKDVSTAEGYLDDFDKANTDLQKLPDDITAMSRPAILLVKNAVGVVSKLQSTWKALAKLLYVKLPNNKGSVGIVANKGISLGTPDRIVGVGGMGVLFVADGGTGLANHARYVPLEDTLNRVINSDLLVKYEKPKDKASAGFRVFSDSTVDLTARYTANLLALGRARKGTTDTSWGAGVARVGASYAIEMAAQEKIVIGAREKDAGRVEVLGATIAVGFNKIDADEGTFGIRERDPATKAWGDKDDLAKSHEQTASVLVHSTKQAVVVVGKYMIQVRDGKGRDAALAAVTQRVEKATEAKNDVEKKILALEKAEAEAVDWELDEADKKKLQELKDAIVPAIKELAAAKAERQAIEQAPDLDDDGVVISLRDAGKGTSSFNVGKKLGPAITLSEKKGVTITTTAGDNKNAKTARITLDPDGKVSVTVGSNETGIMITDKDVMLKNGNNSVKVSGQGLAAAAGEIKFSGSQRITLG